MPRSGYIYVVKKQPGKKILGCFTVKHEAVTALLTIPNERIEVWRVKDGFLNLPHLMGEGLGKQVAESIR